MTHLRLDPRTVAQKKDARKRRNKRMASEVLYSALKRIMRNADYISGADARFASRALAKAEGKAIQ